MSKKLTTPPSRVIIDIGEALSELRKCELFERLNRSPDAVTTELITQCVDYLSDATPDRNPFTSGNEAIPYAVTSLIYGKHIPTLQEQEQLKTVFAKLYVGIRDQIEQKCGASRFVEETGGFNYVLDRRIGQNSAVLRHLNTTETPS